MKKKIIISDKNRKSLKIKKQIISILKNQSLKKANIIIVIGGDGFMLQTLKRNRNKKNIFYGINSGNYGFLMNKFSKKDIIKNINKSNMISISPLEMNVSGKNNTKKSLAIKTFQTLLTHPNINNGFPILDILIVNSLEGCGEAQCLITSLIASPVWSMASSDKSIAPSFNLSSLL